MDLIPLPRKITAQDGLFLINHYSAILLDEAQDDNDMETAKLLQKEIRKVIAITLPVKKVLRSAGNFNENCICFQYDTMDEKKESYRVMVSCLLYTSDAADEEDSVDLGGRRIIKKKKKKSTKTK